MTTSTLQPVLAEEALIYARPRATVAAAPVPGRVRYLVFPREHGAWGMLLVPLVTGGAIGLRTGHGWLPLALLLAGSLALFCLRTPVETLLGASAFRVRSRRERSRVLLAVAGYAAIALTSLGWLLTLVPPAAVLAIGYVAGTALLVQQVIKKLWPRRRSLAQLAGAIALSSTAAAAFYVTTGATTACTVLWAGNWLFAANQIDYVQTHIRAGNRPTRGQRLAKGWGFLLGQVVVIAVLAVAVRMGAVKWPVALAFAPVLVRGFAWYAAAPRALHFRRLGFTELAHALAFGLLVMALF